MSVDTCRGGPLWAAPTRLERHHEVESESPFVDVRKFFVCESSDIVYAEEFEDVVNAHDGFPVRLVAHDMGLRGELEEPAVSRVLVGVVLVGEVPPTFP